MIPRYGEWHEKLGPKGLTVVGVHTPELEHERDPRRVADYARRERIRWPVLLDPDYAAWRRFEIEAWPTIVLIDRTGIVRHVYIGDNHAKEIESAIGRLL